MKAKQTITSIAFFLGGLVLAHGQALDTSRGPEVLKFEWKTGTTYVQKMEMDQNSKISMGGQTMDQKMKMNMEVEMAVSKVPGSSNKKIESEYKRIAMNMNSMGAEMKYDSDSPDTATGPLAAMGGMVGQKFTLIADESNHIVDVQGIEELTKAMGANPMAAQMSKQFLDKKQLEQMMNTWMAKSFPAKAVKPGDTWPVDYTMDMPGMGSVSLKGTFTLAGYQDYNGHDCAVIDMEADISMALTGIGDAEQAEVLKAMAMKVKDGKMASRMYWDNDLNWMRGMDMTQTMSMSMKNPADGTEMTIPMSQKMKMTVEVK
jgi:hypothetical protein